MARAFITGSADGLGLELGRRLDAAGHQVVLHGRNDSGAARRPARRCRTPSARVSGDLASVAADPRAGRAGERARPVRRRRPQRRALVPASAARADRGRARARVRGQRAGAVPADRADRPPGAADLPHLRPAPQRRAASSTTWPGSAARWSGMQAYADSKLLDVVLAFAVARLLAGRALKRGRARAGSPPGWAAPARPGTLAEGDRHPVLAGHRRRDPHRPAVLQPPRGPGPSGGLGPRASRTSFSESASG